MNSIRLRPFPRAPAVIAKWLLIAFATVLLAFLAVPAVAASRAGELEPILSIVALLPWMAGPAALVTLLAARARSRGEAWLFVGAEAAAIASTVWLLIVTTFVKTGHANSEYAVGFILLPVVQFLALLIYSSGVVVLADLVLAKDRQQKQPRVILLTILSTTSAVLLLVLAWSFGYIRA